jgi:hypothetical protein
MEFCKFTLPSKKIPFRREILLGNFLIAVSPGPKVVKLFPGKAAAYPSEAPERCSTQG